MGQGSKVYICVCVCGEGGSHTNIESDPYTQMGREIEREPKHPWDMDGFFVKLGSPTQNVKCSQISNHKIIMCTMVWLGQIG